jgi:hypothetical protein
MAWIYQDEGLRRLLAHSSVPILRPLLAPQRTSLEALLLDSSAMPSGIEYFIDMRSRRPRRFNLPQAPSSLRGLSQQTKLLSGNSGLGLCDLSGVTTILGGAQVQSSP